MLDGTPWEVCAPIAPDRLDDVLAPHLDTGRTLFGNRGAAVPVDECEHGVDASLALIDPADLLFEHEEVAWGSGSRPRAWFRHCGTLWKLPLTDFVIRPRLVRRPFGRYDWDDLELSPRRRSLLTVSLGEPYEGWHHKLVAAVLRLP